MTAKLFLCRDQDGGIILIEDTIKPVLLDGGYWWPAAEGQVIHLSAGIQLPAIDVGECFEVVIVRKD